MFKSPLFLSLLLIALTFLTFASQPRAQSDLQNTWLENKGYNTHVLMPQQERSMLPSAQTPYADEGLSEEPGLHTPRASALPSIYNDTLPPEASFQNPSPSSIEAMYAKRLGQGLFQFGYELFGVPAAADRSIDPNVPPSGAVQDDFVLGSGDSLHITFSGQRSDSAVYTITPQGMLLIKDFQPIPAAGRTIADLRKDITATAARVPNTQIYVSLASVRQIGVLVVGHVKKPGTQTLSAFHTILDALMQSGGVRKDGSLRRIRLVRGGRSQTIDLYDLLVESSAHSDLRLRNGDRIIVPPIGPTVAIGGAVKRSGIYEIRGDAHGKSEKLSLNAMLELAGGLLAPGQNRFLMMTPKHTGSEVVKEIQNAFTPQFSNGAILNVEKGEEMRAGTVEISGHTRRTGLHDLSQNKTLRKLLDSAQALGPDIYPLIGVIERLDHEMMAKRYYAFPVRLVLKNAYDQTLADGDVVYLFSNADILTLQRPGGQARHSPASFTRQDTSASPSLPPPLASYLREHAVFVRGAVRNPGLYPIAEGETLDSVLAVAGGLMLDANANNIEITTSLDQHARGGTLRQNITLHETNPATVNITPGDTVRVNQKFKRVEDKTVLISGEVMNPGHYDLLPGDTVSDLLNRAGGLTDQSYPAGSIFSRESERKAEEMRFRAAAQEMERALAASIQREDKPPSAAQIEMVRGLAAELAAVEAVGRITVETDPSVLSVEPELDMLLESGDRVYIPKRPLTVRVSGEVLSSANLQFRKGKGPLDYIHEAGGFTYHADKDRAFVVYPNGSAQPLQVNVWNHKPIFIPPGSTVVVPRDPKPFDFIESARDFTQILSNLAITSVFIDDLRD